MLEINPDIVCRLIELAHEFHSQEEVVIPAIAGDPGEGLVTQVLADYDYDMSFREFKSIVEDLEPGQQQQIVALLWMGRGDFTTEEWKDALEQANNDWTPGTAEYLIVHPLLADYLADGLDQLGYGCD